MSCTDSLKEFKNIALAPQKYVALKTLAFIGDPVKMDDPVKGFCALLGLVPWITALGIVNDMVWGLLRHPSGLLGELMLGGLALVFAIPLSFLMAGLMFWFIVKKDSCCCNQWLPLILGILCILGVVGDIWFAFKEILYLVAEWKALTLIEFTIDVLIFTPYLLFQGLHLIGIFYLQKGGTKPSEKFTPANPPLLGTK